MTDRETALNPNAAVKAMGFVTEIKTNELFTSEEAVEAFKKAKDIERSPRLKVNGFLPIPFINTF